MGSYCSDFRVIRACLAGIPPLYHSFDLPYTCPIMRTFSRPNRSSGLRIRGSSTEEPDLGQAGEGSNCPTIVVGCVPLAGPPSPSGKVKSKVNEIRYPDSFDYLRVAVQNAEVVGPSRIEPCFGKTFVACYRPPFGVNVWCPDILISYIVQVPKMVCFFKSAFGNGLCIPLSKASYSTLTYVRPNFLPISRAFWSGYWSSLGIKVSGFPA